MAVELSWLVENKVMYMYGHGINTMDDLRQLDSAAVKFIEQSPEPLVHGIIDLRHLEKTPSLFEQRDVWHYPQHSHSGWQIYVGSNDPVQRVMMYLISQLTKARYRQFATIEEGLAFLQDIDPTLPDLKQFKERVPA